MAFKVPGKYAVLVLWGNSADRVFEKVKSQKKKKVKSQAEFLEKTGCSDSKQFHIQSSYIYRLFVCFLMLQSEEEAEI